MNNMFISIYRGAIFDLTENPSRLPTEGLMASLVTTDIFRSLLLSFEVMITTSTLKLTFSKSVNVTSLNPEGITPPYVIEFFYFNLRNGIFKVTFSETIDILSVNVSSVTLQLLYIANSLG